MKRGVDRYVDRLLRGRRPKGFRPEGEDVEVMRTAIDLLAQSPDAAGPSPGFVDRLHRRLNAQAAPEPAPPRRRMLRIATVAAAAAAAGATADHVLHGDGTGPPAGRISPDRGTWQTVMPGADLAEGQVHPFDLGSVNGFVRRTRGRVQAVSGTCTHQGCRLGLSTGRTHLACPCHGATFSLTGESLTHPRSSQALPPLPRLPVREYRGNVQIYAPSASEPA